MGSLIYIIAELIPEWERNNTLQKWVNDIERVVSELFTRR